MLQAILNSKVRNLFSELESQRDWRERYRSTEDFLTASIFARLSYFPSQSFWQILLNAVKPNNRLPKNVGDLKDIQFWPRWNIEDGKQKEPDIFIEFENANLIIEAKLPSNNQYAEQWADEFWAYQYNVAREYDGKNVYFVAIDGLSGNFEQVEKKANEILTSSYDFSDGMCAVAGSWQSLLSAINHFQSTDGSNTVNQFLINDLKKAFKLHGIRDTYWLKSIGTESTLSKLGRLRDSSMVVFNTVCVYHDGKPPVNSMNWFTKAIPYREIRNTSLQTVKEICK